jgi:hypothetical protein
MCWEQLERSDTFGPCHQPVWKRTHTLDTWLSLHGIGDREIPTTCASCVTVCHLERWLHSCSKSSHTLHLASTRLWLRKSVTWDLTWPVFFLEPLTWDLTWPGVVRRPRTCRSVFMSRSQVRTPVQLPITRPSVHQHIEVCYESIKRELKIRGIYECRCDERLVVYYKSRKRELKTKLRNESVRRETKS